MPDYLIFPVPVAQTVTADSVTAAMDQFLAANGAAGGSYAVVATDGVRSFDVTVQTTVTRNRNERAPANPGQGQGGGQGGKPTTP